MTAKEIYQKHHEAFVADPKSFDIPGPKYNTKEEFLNSLREGVISHELWTITAERSLTTTQIIGMYIFGDFQSKKSESAFKSLFLKVLKSQGIL